MAFLLEEAHGYWGLCWELLFTRHSRVGWNPISLS